MSTVEDPIVEDFFSYYFEDDAPKNQHDLFSAPSTSRVSGREMDFIEVPDLGECGSTASSGDEDYKNLESVLLSTEDPLGTYTLPRTICGVTKHTRSISNIFPLSHYRRHPPSCFDMMKIK